MRFARYMLFAMLVSAIVRAGEPLDRIVATVDHHAITRSDVEQEARFTHLTAGLSVAVSVQDEIAALERLVDRNLIADQVAVFGVVPVTRKELDARLLEMRKQLSGSDSETAWQRLLAKNGLTDQDVESRIDQEIQTLRFIDLRFRSEVRV